MCRTLLVVRDRPFRTPAEGLTRRSLLAHGIAAATGLVLAACGGQPERESADRARGENSPAGLDGVRVDVWRDPG